MESAAHHLLPILLGISLAAACGLRVFLPLFIINLIGLGLGPVAVGALSDVLAGPVGLGEAEGVRTDDVLRTILKSLPKGEERDLLLHQVSELYLREYSDEAYDALGLPLEALLPGIDAAEAERRTSQGLYMRSSNSRVAFSMFRWAKGQRGRPALISQPSPELSWGLSEI